MREIDLQGTRAQNGEEKGAEGKCWAFSQIPLASSSVSVFLLDT